MDFILGLLGLFDCCAMLVSLSVGLYGSWVLVAFLCGLTLWLRCGFTCFLGYVVGVCGLLFVFDFEFDFGVCVDLYGFSLAVGGFTAGLIAGFTFCGLGLTL